MRLILARRGNGLVYGMLGTLLLMLGTAALYDGYSAYQLRTWGYQVTGEAARYAALRGVTFDPYTGVLSVDPASARQAAEVFMAQALARRGSAIRNVSWQMQTITSPAGGQVPGFPPVARANLDGGNMRLNGPGVGVYLTFEVPTSWLGVIGMSGLTLHTFSAAEVTGTTP